jgi:hypothetical protein
MHGYHGSVYKWCKYLPHGTIKCVVGRTQATFLKKHVLAPNKEIPLNPK